MVVIRIESNKNNLGITIIAVSIAERPRVDEAELLMIAGDHSRVFAPWNLQEFEAELMKHVGFGCDGIELGPDASESFYSFSLMKRHFRATCSRSNRHFLLGEFSDIYSENTEGNERPYVRTTFPR